MIATALETLEVQGWFHHGQTILDLIEQHQPKVCVELGTWLGASAIPVARSIRRWNGTLTCVDTWSGDVQPPALPARQSAPWILVSCVRNLMASGVGAHVRLIPAMTREAAAVFDRSIDYLYIDADHSYAGVSEDLRAWVPHVRPWGLIIGDDYGHPLFPGVRQAWDEWEAEHGVTLNRTPPDAEGIRLIYGTVQGG